MASTPGRICRALTSGARNHLGPAVNKKPVKNRGMKPRLISSACTKVSGTAMPMCEAPALRPSITSHHNSAATVITATALANASRCGACNSKAQRHVAGCNLACARACAGVIEADDAGVTWGDCGLRGMTGRVGLSAGMVRGVTPRKRPTRRSHGVQRVLEEQTILGIALHDHPPIEEQGVRVVQALQQAPVDLRRGLQAQRHGLPR